MISALNKIFNDCAFYVNINKMVEKNVRCYEYKLDIVIFLPDNLRHEQKVLNFFKLFNSKFNFYRFNFDDKTYPVSHY